jgi:hypothetical protein
VEKEEKGMEKEGKKKGERGKREEIIKKHSCLSGRQLFVRSIAAAALPLTRRGGFFPRSNVTGAWASPVL